MTTTAESAALQILRAVEGNQRRVLVGIDAKFLDKVVRFLDAATDSLKTDTGLGTVTRIGKIAMVAEQAEILDGATARPPRDGRDDGRRDARDSRDIRDAREPRYVEPRIGGPAR